MIALRASPPLKRALLLLLLGCGVAIALHPRRAPAPQPDPVDVTCVEPEARDEPAVTPLPGPDVYALLDACLRSGHHPWGDLHVDVAQVRYWVEVEHDPAWFEPGNASWWLPLSGEGDAQFPSGVYMSVPISGASCGGALVN